MRELIRASVRRMEGYVPGEQLNHPDVVKLNTNENPYPPAPGVQHVLEGLVAERLRLYPDPECSALREELARLHGCDVSNVFVGNGSDEVLALCTRAFVENGGSIGFFEPSYSLYPVLADIRDVEQRPVSLGSDFEWQMPDDYSASLFLMTRPNAPTGLLYPRTEVDAFCRRFDGVVVVDEAYADFARDECTALALELPNVLVARTLSKAYSLAAIRLGYVIGPAPLIGALTKIKDSYNVNALTQAIAVAAVRDQDYVREIVGRIRSTRERLGVALTKMGFSVVPSDTNFLWVRPPDGQAAKDVFDRLRAQRILVRYFSGERTGGFLRVTVGTNEQVDRLLAALREMNL